LAPFLLIFLPVKIKKDKKIINPKKIRDRKEPGVFDGKNCKN